MSKILLFLVGLLLLTSCSFQHLNNIQQARKASSFEQVDFHELIQRYMNKEAVDDESIEGVYSVSAVIVKKGKRFLSSEDRERVMVRKENYSKVAILKDKIGSDREYIEISLDKEKQPSYSVRGEFTRMTEANILIYTHFEQQGETLSYTFTFDRSREILEGIRKEMKGQSEMTYKLTYIKINPYRDNQFVRN
ncbi:MAG: hypothetical protein U5K54_24500 [Cytophagales bacterium]|nr:hypothetical protein [Cytophagales bacterium]